MNTQIGQSASHEWFRGLTNLLRCGSRVAPRGQGTVELLQQTFTVDLNRPVVRCPLRKLNYRFMAAEAYWILTGDDTVAGIAPYNSHIAQFSDDGKKFTGAYGPRIKEQLDWAIGKLLTEETTRQAGIIIWKDMPAPSRDIPCTVAIWFTIRDRHLHVHVFMRSSDIWLGLPYDIFSFSMLGWLVAGKLNLERKRLHMQPVFPGRLHLTAASSHLYDRDQAKAQEVARAETPTLPSSSVPLNYAVTPNALLELLEDLRENTERRWWL